jgi:hypothetical protein
MVRAYNGSMHDWASLETTAEAGSGRLRNGWKFVAVVLLVAFIVADLLAASYLLRSRTNVPAAIAPGGTLSVPRLRYLPGSETTEFQVSGPGSPWLYLVQRADAAEKD